GYGADVGFGEADGGQWDRAHDRFGACGAAVVTTRRTLQEIGPLAGPFFAYYEDTDWCWRAQLHGMRVHYNPDTVVRHVVGATSGGLQSMAVRNLSARNRLLCLVRNAPLGEAWRHIRAEVFGTPPAGLERGPLAYRLPEALAQRA